jgi:rhodanese-related sulfurtransferase
MNILKSLFGSTGAHLSAQEASVHIENDPSVFILDVRQPEEYKAGHIPRAKLIPLNQLGSRLKELPQDREIICVCQSGSRSSFATSQLLSAGYNALNLSGGMTAWQSAGLPVKRGK